MACVSYHGKEKGVDTDNGRELRAGSFIADQLTDAANRDAPVAIESRPHGLHELIGSRVIGSAHDAVAKSDRHQRMHDRGRDVLHKLEAHREGTRSEQVFFQLWVNVAVV